LGSGIGEIVFADQEINSLLIDQGSGQLKIKLDEAALPTEEFSLELGSGSIEIDLSSEVGLRVRYEIGSGNLRIGSDSIGSGDGTYTTINFDTAQKKLEFTVQIGSGSVTID
jgi:hypothetical protein